MLRLITYKYTQELGHTGRKLLSSLNKELLLPSSSSFAIQERLRKHALFSTSSKKDYEQTFDKSIKSPENFWEEAAQGITWFSKYDKVLDNSNSPFTKWFVGGHMNTCYEGIDVHVNNGNGEDIALIYDSPVTNTKKHLSYNYMLNQVSRFSRVLVNNGVKKGDRVVIYMPMIPEAIIAMYACARIGAIHSVVFGGFAAQELARRIDDAEKNSALQMCPVETKKLRGLKHCKVVISHIRNIWPKVLVTASCGIESTRIIQYEPLVHDALQIANHKVNKVVTVNREQCPRKTFDDQIDVDWNGSIESTSCGHDCVPIEANEPLYILYTSGTTGKPKGVVRPCGGHAVALKWSLPKLYDINPGDVWWAASDIGWVVGHSYIVYAPFFNKTTSILYEGKPIGCPDASTFFRVVDEHKVSALFTAPTAVRVIRNEDQDGTFAKKYKMESFKHLFLAGENADKEILQWASNVFRSPVIDHWWQTESGWPITSHHVGLGLPSNYGFGTIGKPTPGWNVKVLSKDGKDVKPGNLGQIFVKLPLPPGAFSTLWRDDDRFVDAYFSTKEGYYNTMDAGTIDENGYIQIGGRVDDIINVAGHRLSTKQIEMAVAKHDDVMEETVIGVKDDVKGEQAVGLVVLRKGFTHDPEVVIKEVIDLVRREVGPVASFKRVYILPTLPKTRAGKFLRGTMKKILDGEEYTIPQTVENPDDFPIIEKLLLEQKKKYDTNNNVTSPEPSNQS